MKPEPMSVPDVGRGPRAVSQPVDAPLTRAAIFLVATVNPGFDHRATLRSFCAELSALLRAVEFRDLEAGLSCVVGFRSHAWDRLFGPPRPAELHPFREIRAGERRAVSTRGDLLFHIRAKRMDLCFEVAMQIMARLGDAVSPVDEVHGFRYFDDRDLMGFVDGTENPRGEAMVDAVLVGDERTPGSQAAAMSSCRNISRICTDGMHCPRRRRSGSSAAPSSRISNWTILSNRPRRTARSQPSSRTGKKSRSCATTGGHAGARSDPGHLRATRGEDYEGPRGKGPGAPVCVDPAAGDDQPSVAVAEREDSAPHVGGLSTSEETVWGRHLWARGYFCCSSGNVTDEVIAKYIAEQNIEQDEDFRVDG